MGNLKYSELYPFSESSEAWLPSQMNTNCWLDFGDLSTITILSGKISQINDKSSNNHNAIQASVSGRPLLIGDGAKFDGIDDSLDFSTPIPMSSGQSVVAVVDTSLLGTGPRLFLQRNGVVSPPYPPALYLGGATNYQSAFYWGAGWHAQQTAPTQRLHIIRFYLESNQSSTMLSRTLVDEQNASTSTLGGNFPLTNWVSIGVTGVSQEPALFIKEFIVCNTEIDKVVGYLAWKHGLTSLLSLSHPYKLSPPTL